MASDRSFVEFIAEQARLESRLTHRKMFGEYALYLSGKVVGFACDNRLFIKPFDATAPLTAGLPLDHLFPDSKLYPLADELLDDPPRLRELLLATEATALLPRVRRPRLQDAPAAAGASTSGRRAATAKPTGRTAAAGRAGSTDARSDAGTTHADAKARASAPRTAARTRAPKRPG